MVLFKEEGHKYIGITPNTKNVRWISATKFVELFCPPFDDRFIASKSSMKPTSKWFGMDVDEILRIWKEENKRSTHTGSIHHAIKENEILSEDFLEFDDFTVPVHAPMYYDNGDKISCDQSMEDGAYPEGIVWMKLNERLGICGQSDLPIIHSGYAHVLDHKTNKKIDMFNDWENMLYPFENYDHCNFNHYQIQLSLYMYIILFNNRNLKPGKIEIYHTEFEKDGENEYGFPIIRMNNGAPVVKGVNPYPMKYLEKEIELGIKVLIKKYAA